MNPSWSTVPVAEIHDREEGYIHHIQCYPEETVIYAQGIPLIKPFILAQCSDEDILYLSEFYPREELLELRELDMKIRDHTVPDIEIPFFIRVDP